MTKPASDELIDELEYYSHQVSNDTMLSLIARIRQQDEYINQLCQDAQCNYDWGSAAVDDLKEAKEETERLRAALEPFSTFAGALFERNFNASDVVYRISRVDGTVIELKAGAFFKARAALKGGEG